MFESLSTPAPDKIIQLIGLFAADPRPDKVDLGVGVYRAPDGRTPIMRAVKEAEKRVWDAQETKAYVGFAGDPAFHAAMRQLILGDAVPMDRVAACATPGGTGAVRQILEMTREVTPEARIWISDPSWPNHAVIVDHLGLSRRSYRYYDAATGGIDRDGMYTDLADAKPGDLILLHGCCHNPTGADLLRDDWARVAQLCAQTGAIPFIDMAYQGFGDGLEEDAAGTRLLAAQLPECLIAASGSKNFGLYRDRVGIALAVTSGGAARDAAAEQLVAMNRKAYSFPPDHGARIVDVIVSDEALLADWAGELADMRVSMQANRKALADELRAAMGSDRFGFLASHKGMFSLCGITPEQAVELREGHGVYIVEDGRVNVAGLTPSNIPIVAKAMAAVLR
ncbi:aromatic amino acid transaminase [Gymnodinialimonas hymeniacidonis]|uniref:amino acid aminotransferase n=1 Tax=Gymnodinialimonas hymeniacidonis TaxID=3126508 RepID=UPI0034C5C539